MILWQSDGNSMKNNLPLIVVVGPTASGKTGLAIELAHEYGGEIISADSRAIYKHMNIGTAKPSRQERKGVPHWGLDLLEPGERFSAADFKHYANQKIDEIRQRGHVPFLVGGTGLYVDAVVFDYRFGPPADDARRQALEILSIEELKDYCISHNVVLPENIRNKRYLIRAIEQQGVNQQRNVIPRDDAIIVGIATDRVILRQRIEKRIEQIFEDNVVDEATRLGKIYGWDNEAMTGNIYPVVHQYLQGSVSFEEMKARCVTLDWRLAKRQLTWLRRNPYIVWKNLAEARQYLRPSLANE
jgi:tRNA dimethylallyltransferase